MNQIILDPVTTGEDGATLRHIEERFNRFENKNTWWRHDQNGSMKEFDRLYEEAVERIRTQLGADHPVVVAGEERARDTFEMVSPADKTLVVGRYAKGTKQDVRDALASAKQGYEAWRKVPWQERCAIIERTADLYAEHFYDLCAVMTFETGKTRFEASIDVDEAIDFLRYYAFSMREMGGFDTEMGKPFPNETCRSIRKPFGVFGVLCPFNFPVAITTGMTVAALITGNTVVVKPSTKGCLAGWWCFRLLKQAGVPDDVLHFITGEDQEVAVEMLDNPDFDGYAFTGSRHVGMMALQKNLESGRPRPFIAEMGGKNAVTITKNADLDKAVQGVFKSAFGFSGQKCSACSRVYVDDTVADEFLARLAKLTKAAAVGKPWDKATYMGPVIEQKKLDLYREVIDQVRADGGEIVAGGEVREDEFGGWYVAPTVVTGLPKDHRVFREEFFMPFVAVHRVASLDKALAEVNASEYGLTSGIMSEDEAEVQHFFDNVEAGVVYANRTAGASTAAVVNGQVFGGWKLSGSTGNGTGRYYLQQFTRERSQTVAL